MTEWAGTAEWVGLGVIGAMALAIGVLGVFALIRIRGYRHAGLGRAPSPPQGESGYEPLARLMRGDDVEFLRAQPNCGPGLAVQWDRGRRRIVRMYLNEIAADFQSLHAQARALVAEAPEQYADLAQALMGQQLLFWRTMAGIELRLLLSRLGAGTVEGGALVRLLDGMRAEIARSTASVTA